MWTNIKLSSQLDSLGSGALSPVLHRKMFILQTLRSDSLRQFLEGQLLMDRRGCEGQLYKRWP